MCRLHPVVQCVLLLVVTYAMEDQENSTAENKQGDAAQYKFDVNFIIWNHDKNSTTNNEDSMKHSNHKKNHKKNSQVSIEFRNNSTKMDDGDKFAMSSELRPRNNSDKDNSKQMCNSTICISICCELGYRLIKGICTSGTGNYLFPEVYGTNKEVDKVFQLVVSDPCQKTERFLFKPDELPEDEYVILANGSIYQPNVNYIIDSATYCFALIKNDKYELTTCSDETYIDTDIYTEDKGLVSITVSLIVSLPFFLLTFVVYTILPDFWNMHGYTLRGYIGSLFVSYTFLAGLRLIPSETLPEHVCAALAFITYFSFLASFFWLNVMCFDIWWTFGTLLPVQRSMTEEERKKFIMYSVYAWGCASTLTIICVIMDFVPNIPERFITPEFGKERCWFTTDEAIAMYFDGPISITIICNICLFISTTLKFVWHKKNTISQLRSSQIGHHIANKQPFILYMKLFILMGVNWSMEIIPWLFKNSPWYIWYFSDLINSLQGLIIFVIFVWKDTIKKQLLKRFNCHEYTFSLFCRKACSFCHGTTLFTCITKGVISLWENINPCKKIYIIWTKWCTKNWSVKSEFSEVFYNINATQGKGLYRANLQSANDN